MQRKRGLRLGRPFGFPLLVHRSWLGAGALGAVHLSFTAFGASPLPAAVGLGLAAVVLVFLSVVFHEAAHALVRRMIRVGTVDVTLFVFGGVARTQTEPRRPGDEAAAAMAGPVASAGLGLGLLRFAGMLDGTPSDLVEIVAVAGFALAVVNVLPGYPLDGGRVLVAYLWRRRGDRGAAMRTAARTGAAWGIAAVLTGIWLGVTSRTGDASGTALALWFVLVGVFVVSEAARARRGAKVAGLVANGTAGSWARPFAGRVRVESPAPSEGGPYAVSDGPRLAGVLMPEALAVSDGRPAGELMIPWSPAIALEADTPIPRVIEQLASSAAGVLVVLDEGGIVRGVIDTEGVRSRLGEE